MPQAKPCARCRRADRLLRACVSQLLNEARIYYDDDKPQPHARKLEKLAGLAMRFVRSGQP